MPPEKARDSSSANSDSPVSSTQRVVEDLRKRIIQGELLPGEKLKVESLKTLLDTGAVSYTHLTLPTICSV